jgi:hypothetical protein
MKFETINAVIKTWMVLDSNIAQDQHVANNIDFHVGIDQLFLQATDSFAVSEFVGSICFVCSLRLGLTKYVLFFNAKDSL